MATLASSTFTETTNLYTYLYSQGNYYDIAQTFTVPVGFTWDITAVTLRLRKGTDFVDGLTVSICGISGGDPDTTDVKGTASYDTSGVGTGSYSNDAISVTASDLAAGTYAIVVQTTNQSDGNDFAPFMLIGGCASSAYAGGGFFADIGSVPRDNSWNGPSIYYDLCFSITGTASAGHAKASNPTPADTATGVDFSTPTLDWDGNGDTYDVRGGAAGNFVLLASGLSASTYTLTEQQKTFFKNGVVTWRVDSTKDGDTLTGDDWTFDPRPGQATNPTPTNAGSDISLEQQFSWDAVDYTDTYDVVISGSTVSSAQDGVTFDLDSDYYTWEEAVTWRVDSTNEYGTTTGTNWTFTATPLDYTRITWTSINGGSGPDDGGVEGVDFWYTGLNNVITVNRLVCMAKDTFYYESLGEV